MQNTNWRFDSANYQGILLEFIEQFELQIHHKIVSNGLFKNTSSFY
jgi:hypothetical protein